jgi:hypothetical protein
MRAVDMRCDFFTEDNGSVTLTIVVTGLTFPEARQVADLTHVPVRDAVVEATSKGGPYRIEDMMKQ